MAPLVFPDPPSSLGSLSGATLLYFEQPILVGLPAACMLRESRDLFRVIMQRKPSWKSQFDLVAGLAPDLYMGVQRTLTAFESLPSRIRPQSVYLAYPGTRETFEHAGAFMTSVGLRDEQVLSVIDPRSAAADVMRHILTEAFIAVGKDVGNLYDYCEELFGRESATSLLAKGFFVRLRSLPIEEHASLKMLVLNERLSELIRMLPYEVAAEEDVAEHIIDNVGWEIFRQILSPHLDPLDIGRLRIVSDIATTRKDELQRFRSRCLTLTEELRASGSATELSSAVAALIEKRVSQEVADLLELDRTALEEYFVEVFSSTTMWASILTLVTTVLCGNLQDFIQTGSIISALSVTSAHAVKALSRRSKKLHSSDYALVYTISTRVKSDQTQMAPGLFTSEPLQ